MRISNGVRVVALFEGAKGFLAVVVGCAVLSALHADTRQAAEDLMRQLHLNPVGKYGGIVVDLAGRATPGQLALFGYFAFFYAAIRFVEGYGLWRERRWAEWFAAISGSIYIPLEIYELLRGVSLIKAGSLLINVAIVVYIIYELTRRRKNTDPRHARKG
jgi:uncharacterized membrane protein (DUF2068 family)